MSVTWLSIALNLVLGAIKVLAGWAGQSIALMADGFHSLVDLSTDAAVLFGLKIAEKPSDADHPYGHHRFSTVASLFIALILVFVCCALVYKSLQMLAGGFTLIPRGAIFWVAVASLVIKEWLFWKTRRAAMEQRSQLLLVNAWHHRSDSLSSLAVASAIGAVAVGGPRWAFIDPVLGAGLGMYLGFEGVKLLFVSLNELVDRAPAGDIVNDLREHILPTPGVVAYHAYRARRVGDMYELDLHLQIDPGATVREGHAIAESVKRNIFLRHPEVLNALIHVEPASETHLVGKGVSDVNPGRIADNMQG